MRLVVEERLRLGRFRELLDRERLRRELGDPGQPQLLLRVGYGPRPRATPRRPVDLVVRSFSSDLAVEIGIDAAEPAPVARPA